jgi:hypothetical protein
MLSLFATEKKQHLVKCFCELSLLLDSQIHCLAAQHNLLRGETNIPYPSHSSNAATGRGRAIGKSRPNHLPRDLRRRNPSCEILFVGVQF